jgi:hypothetical protein
MQRECTPPMGEETKVEGSRHDMSLCVMERDAAVRFSLRT